MSIKKNILQGIRVLDLSQFLSGPHTTLLLAGLGAEVIRVDNPKTGTLLAKTPIYYGKEGPSFKKRDETDLGIAFLKRCRGKKSVTIDLKSEKGHELFLKLAKESDILVENFSVGVTQRLKVDWPSLNQINSRLIYCSLTGYGSKGPDCHKKGYDITTQAMSGLMSVTGQADGPPTKAGTPLADTISAGFAIKKQELGSEENWSRMDWRVANNEMVDELMINWTSKQLTKDALKDLEEMDVVVSPVQNINDLLNWPHLKSRGMINDVEHPQLGKLKRLKAAGFPIQFSTAETGYKTPSVPSGTNNHEVFVDLLGLEESEYKKLKEDSII